jgi:hypothetical protein
MLYPERGANWLERETGGGPEFRCSMKTGTWCRETPPTLVVTQDESRGRGG